MDIMNDLNGKSGARGTISDRIDALQRAMERNPALRCKLPQSTVVLKCADGDWSQFGQWHDAPTKPWARWNDK